MVAPGLMKFNEFNISEKVFSPTDLKKGEITSRIRIISKEMRYLFKDDDNSDSGQHPLDNR